MEKSVKTGSEKKKRKNFWRKYRISEELFLTISNLERLQN